MQHIVGKHIFFETILHSNCVNQIPYAKLLSDLLLLHEICILCWPLKINAISMRYVNTEIKGEYRTTIKLPFLNVELSFFIASHSLYSAINIKFCRWPHIQQQLNIFIGFYIFYDIFLHIVGKCIISYHSRLINELRWLNSFIGFYFFASCFPP